MIPANQHLAAAELELVSKEHELIPSKISYKNYKKFMTLFFLTATLFGAFNPECIDSGKIRYHPNAM